MIPLTDVSYWQGAIDFTVMKTLGVQGVLIRAGRGIEVDTNFQTNVTNARAARLKIGCYWFVNPTASADPRVPARMLARVYKLNALDIPPMMDAEWYSAIGPYPALSGADFAAYLRTFSNTVKRNARRPMIYTNVNYWNPNVGSDTFGDHQLFLSKWINSTEVPDPPLWADWVASVPPPVIPMGWTAWNGWQFSANFNAQGAKYGVSSIDICLDLVTDATWKSWMSIRK